MSADGTYVTASFFCRFDRPAFHFHYSRFLWVHPNATISGAKHQIGPSIACYHRLLNGDGGVGEMASLLFRVLFSPGTKYFRTLSRKRLNEILHGIVANVFVSCEHLKTFAHVYLHA
jgi:hypothetical protein